MKYKKLTNDQIIISLDRLTRFKNTREKYLRVFIDILINNLIEPKIKKNDICNMDFSLISKYISEIFNGSLEKSSNDITINNILLNYENTVFNNDEATQYLLNNTIDYISAIELLPDDCPINLKWLKSLKSKADLKTERETKLLKYPIEKVILVEGITEEILLPAFSKQLGYDFYAHGIQIIPAGGKNQVVKLYYKLSQELKLPIFVLLDKDAEDNILQIKPKLRNIDKIHLVSCGEFEDLLPKKLVVKTVNSDFKNFLTINEKDLEVEMPTAVVLETLFKTKGLHEFKKADFAKLVRDNIESKDDASIEIINIIEEIFIK